MLGNIATKSVIWILRHARISNENRLLLTGAILDKLAALPLRDIIYIDDHGYLIVNGRRVEDVEKAQALRNSAVAALDNHALKFIREQVLYQASVLGRSKAITLEDMIFSRAAMWWGFEEDKILKKLTQEDTGNSTN